MSNLTCSAAAYLRLRTNGDADQPDLVWLGITLGLLGSVFINLGQNIEAYAIERNNELKQNPKGARKPIKFGCELGERTGVFMFVTAAIVNFVAFTFAPASILAPLEGSQFVVHFIFLYLVSDRLLIDATGKHTSNFGRVFLGTCMVVVGVVVPVVSSPSSVAVFDEEALWCFWRKPLWLIWMSCTLTLGLLCATYLKFTTPITFLPRLRSTQERSEHKPSGDRVQMFIYSIFAASLGGFGVANAKIISELVELLLKPQWNILATGLFWMTLAFIILGMGLWVRFLTQASNRWFTNNKIIPIIQGFYILSSSFGGGIYFQEFDGYNTRSAIGYGLGMGLLVLGLFLIATPEESHNMENNTSHMAFRVGAGGIPIGVNICHRSDLHESDTAPAHIPLLSIKS